MPTADRQERAPKPAAGESLLRQAAVDVIRPGPRRPLVQPGIDLDADRRVIQDRSRTTRPTRSLNAFSSSGLLWTVGTIAILTALLTYSVQPVMRLTPDPPADFLSVRTNSSIDEQRFAKSYWGCARNLPYVHGVPLPADPPLQFRIPEEHALSDAEASNIRRLYWKQLEKSWYSPAAWQTTYAWKWLSSLSEMLRELLSAARRW